MLTIFFHKFWFLSLDINHMHYVEWKETLPFPKKYWWFTPWVPGGLWKVALFLLSCNNQAANLKENIKTFFFFWWIKIDLTYFVTPKTCLFRCATPKNRHCRRFHASEGTRNIENPSLTSEGQTVTLVPKNTFALSWSLLTSFRMPFVLSL